ncbi:Small glutamine-rich tetratricopeptide repeat-containing protein 2 [Coemansia sp. RSA 1722]|nr:Small glutamine-rich tetratricopeptide repeat-containing protein 2 [Coemansia sp. RSA 486]KAJ2586109.1 Small glutamine-rich tetratricopeptide repeat-containing protein 2 [Coemansia sp. RSA 1722]
MSSESEHNRKRLAMGIVEYLEKAVSEGTVSGDGAESLEIAKQCIADAFEINTEDEAQVKDLSLKPFSLDKVFEVYLNAQAKVGTAAGGAEAQGSASASASTEPSAVGPSDDDRKRAEELKAEGNAFVAKKEYTAAINAYTNAIELVNDNAVYYGNRAAAYSQNGDHAEAVDDAKKALEVDPNYVRGYSRLGRAYFGLGEFELAAEAYEKGLEMDPENSVMRSSLESVKARLGSSADSSRSAVPTSNSTGSSSNAGASAGGFDIGSLLNNPALMGMAQNMMANGGLDRLMSNPAIAQMANNYRSNGQMPSMSDLMNNPDLANLARDFSGMSGNNTNAGDQNPQGGSAAGSNPMASLLNNPALMNMAQQFMRGNNNSSSGGGANNGDNNSSN